MATIKKFMAIMFIIAMPMSSLGQAQTMSMERRYQRWMAENGRISLNGVAEDEHFEIFKKNAMFVDKTNSDDKPFRLALNEWADTTNEEFKTRLGYKPYNVSGRAGGLPLMSTMKSDEVQEVPARVDWREKGAVNPARAQGGCGCCWAFSTVAVVEAINMIKRGKLPQLSEQELVDCNRSEYNKGCDGGSMVVAFDYIKGKGGLASQRQYPYKGMVKGGSCNKSQTSHTVATISGFERVPANDEKALMKAVAKQPVAIAVDSTCNAFRFYSSGILTESCGNKPDHAVAVVGYGEEKGMKYWLVKNSWGANWGENGFIRMRRESGIPNGICGLTMDASYPLV